MQESDRVIDEYTLAAFLAGTLGDDEREEVVEYLAGNSDAREVVRMAADALQAARSSGADDPAARDRTSAEKKFAGRRPARRTIARSERRSRPGWMEGAKRYVAATLFVFVVGMILRLSFGPPTDALRSTTSRSGAELTVDVSLPGPSIEWPEVENAYKYRLVVWDIDEARVAGTYETMEEHVAASDSIMQTMREDLSPGRAYSLRVDAIDPQNRLIRSSSTVDFVLD
ncbi:MAG: hypothetical protein WD021_08310 [Rhodothermales bacterium]